MVLRKKAAVLVSRAGNAKAPGAVLYVRRLVMCPHKKRDGGEVTAVSALPAVVADTTFTPTKAVQCRPRQQAGPGLQWGVETLDSILPW